MRSALVIGSKAYVERQVDDEGEDLASSTWKEKHSVPLQRSHCIFLDVLRPSESSNTLGGLERDSMRQTYSFYNKNASAAPPTYSTLANASTPRLQRSAHST